MTEAIFKYTPTSHPPEDRPFYSKWDLCTVKILAKREENFARKFLHMDDEINSDPMYDAEFPDGTTALVFESELVR